MQRIEFHGAEGRLVKTFEAFGYESRGVRGKTRRPERAVMTSHVRGTTTILRVIESWLDEALDPEMLTAEGIARIQPEDVVELLMGMNFEVRFSYEE